MKIAANLGVLDEIDLIAKCINHLRSIGVDLIVVTDAGSADGTAEVLQEFSADPDICLIQLAGPDDLWGFPERMYEKTISDFSVDYVISLDADEFWLPKTGHLKNTNALQRADILQAPRFNIPLVENQPLLPEGLSPDFYDQIYLVVDPVKKPREEFRKNPELAAVMTHVLPKTMIRPSRVAGFTMGGHGALPRDGNAPIEHTCDDLLIAHLPFSTYDRFARKLKNIDRSLSSFGHRLNRRQAWTWRRWLALAKEGKAQEEFDRQSLTQEQFKSALAEGIVQTAGQWLERRQKA